MEPDKESDNGKVEDNRDYDYLHERGIHVRAEVRYPFFLLAHLPGLSLGFKVKKPSFVTPSFCTLVTTFITSP